MGAKSIYTDRRKKLLNEIVLNNDPNELKGILKDYTNFHKYVKNWQRVNFDEFIEKFSEKKAITSDTYNMTDNRRKIKFFDDGFEYEISCAIGGQYFRIQRQAYIDSKGVKHGAEYVGIDLKPPKVPGGLRKQAAKELFNQLTHFAMTYKKGTV